jgi:hypothetical protein
VRKLLLLFGLIFCASFGFGTSKAHAANCPLAAGSTITTSTFTSCGAGNTVVLAAGNFTVAPNTTVPCGVSLVGPTPTGGGGSQPAYSQTHNQTAVISTTNGYENYGFEFTANCSGSQTFQYLEWNGGRPTNGTVSITLCASSSQGQACSGNLNPSGGSGCTTQTITSTGYNQQSVSCGNGGGNFAYLPAGTKNVSFLNNYVHGANCGFYCGDRHASLIYLDSPGGQSTAGGTTPTFPSGYGTTDNITVAWNIFGTSGDCAQSIVYNYNMNTEGGGGTCNGVSAQSGSTNFIVENNTFTNEDDELKFYELATNSGPPATGSAGYCIDCYFNYNAFQQFNRIGLEMQINWGGPNESTLEYTQYNSFSNHLNPMQQDYDISQADGCIYNFNTSSQTGCVNHVDYNMAVGDGGPVGAGIPGFEYWAGIGSTGNGNFWSGSKEYVSFQWDPSGQYTFNNNTVLSSQNNGNACVNSGQTVCVLQNGQSNPAYSQCPGTYDTTPAYVPSCSGNYSQTSNGTITSVVPGLSASGNIITITNTNVSSPNGSNPGRDSNTTFWCTSDGTTPVVGGAAASAGNTAVPYWIGAASQTVATVTTVGSGTFKCLGMWGAPNQPYSYLSPGSGGGGYVPSAVVSVAYSGTPTTATPTFSPGSGTNFSSPISVTVSDTSPSPTIYCTTNGTTPTTSSPVYGTPFPVSATTTIQCIATSSGLAQSPVGSATYTYVAPPALTGCYQGNTTPYVNTLPVGGTAQQIMQCQYASGTSPLQCSPSADANGSVVTTWGTTNAAILGVGGIGATAGCTAGNQGPGCAIGVAPGAANVTGSVTQNGTVTACSQWTFTIEPLAATPTFAPAMETFSGTISVTPSSTTSGATLYCTTNGTTPTTSSPVYSAPYSISTTTTVKCIATASGFSQSTIGSATYTQATVATPVFTPPSQSFTGTLSVSAASSTPATTLHCTTNGTTPTTSSPTYSSPFSVTANTTIQCLGVASGYQNSAIGSGVYTNSTATLTSCTMTSSPNVTTLQVGGATTQMTGQCYYASSGQTLACSPTADANGSQITAWGSSNSTILAVGLVSSGSPGVASGVTAGSASATATATGGKICTPYAFTVTAPTLTGVAISLQNPPGGTSITIGTPVQACGTISYTGIPSTLECGNSADIYGTTLGTWTSSVPANATISTSGLVTGVAAGSTNVGVSATLNATTVTSSPLSLTIHSPNLNVTITIDGVTYSGTVVLQ